MASTKRLKAKQKSRKVKKLPYTQKISLSLRRSLRNWLAGFKSPYFFNACSVLFILIGFVFVFLAATNSLGLDWKHPYLPKPAIVKAHTIQSKPITLYIPKLNRVLHVSDGEFVNNHWTISPTGVSYLVSSAAPGSTGNSVIYGHNLDNVFGDLYLVKEGDPIYVVLSTGKIVKYQVSEEKEVTPETR